MKRPKVQSSKNLLSLWKSGLEEVQSGTLIEKKRIARRIPAGSALLFWGKAAQSASAALQTRGAVKSPRLVISHEDAGHPFPDPRSFAMGERLLQFFDYLGRSGVRDLAVFLSGGASSLAWIRPAGLSAKRLRRELTALYRKPLSIRELNRSRSRLCLLKAGGAARLLKLLAPSVRAKVYVISDVAPFGSDVVGSGPFTGLPHFVLADNATFAQALRAQAVSQGESILGFRHSLLGRENQWAHELSRSIRAARAKGRAGILIRAGEPAVRIPKGAPRGGRQCRIAARLALEFWEEIRRGEIEILCASSDGADGTSGAAAAHLHRRKAMPAMSPSLQRQLEKAIASYDTARFLSRHGFLIPSFATGTNVQDIVLVRIGNCFLPIGSPRESGSARGRNEKEASTRGRGGTWSDLSSESGIFPGRSRR